MGHDGRMHAQPEGGPDSGTATSAEPQTHSYPRVTSFRSRRSTLTDAQQEVWDRVWPQVGMQARPGGQDASVIQALDTSDWFGRQAPVVLEIGCGTGTSTLTMAQEEPDIDVVAVEVYRRGLAHLVNGIDRENVTNIRLVRGDGVDVLEHMFPTGALTGVRVFFPDPRHHKRRLLQQHNIALMSDRLQPGGVLHAATDHAGYAVQIAEVGDAEPTLRRAEPGEILPISVERPTTKYESKAHHVGSAITELIWVRRP
jgi:tRNA (guanine-N7-)-methyltransferase